MPDFTTDQLDEYFQRIRLPDHPFDRKDLTLCTLSTLLRHQVSHVPFETLSLHYSVDKKISLDSDALFAKIVRRRRGGYCLENNAFFGCVLQSLGFQTYGVICRISKATWGVRDGSWRPMSHMANIVILDGAKYLVDVGYGADGPVVPLPLNPGAIYAGLPSQEIKLDTKTLPQYRDPSKKAWVYSQRRGGGDWNEVYHFPDVEVLPADFNVLNFYNMTQSLWARTVVAQRFVPEDGHEGRLVTTLTLVRNEVRSGDGISQEPVVTETFRSEGERLNALQLLFGIILSEEEQSGIRGTPTELLTL
ncbi:hypothetical protein F5883DRAFT_474044 [Diaporthe sp. PMI_573]|nr:hypothetical protein F5883DRAFT_474044 [Diaporthaceae sp. PMI_573]